MKNSAEFSRRMAIIVNSPFFFEVGVPVDRLSELIKLKRELSNVSSFDELSVGSQKLVKEATRSLPEGKNKLEEKALSALSETSGGALVPSPEFRGVKKKRTSWLGTKILEHPSVKHLFREVYVKCDQGENRGMPGPCPGTNQPQQEEEPLSDESSSDEVDIAEIDTDQPISPEIEQKLDVAAKSRVGRIFKAIAGLPAKAVPQKVKDAKTKVLKVATDLLAKRYGQRGAGLILKVAAYSAPIPLPGSQPVAIVASLVIAEAYRFYSKFKKQEEGKSLDTGKMTGKQIQQAAKEFMGWLMKEAEKELGGSGDGLPQVKPSPFRKSLSYFVKGEGEPCVQGETSASDGCIPASGNASGPSDSEEDTEEPEEEETQDYDPEEMKEYEKEYEEWEAEKNKLEEGYNAEVEKWEKKNEKIAEDYQKEHDKWEAETEKIQEEFDKVHGEWEERVSEREEKREVLDSDLVSASDPGDKGSAGYDSDFDNTEDGRKLQITYAVDFVDEDIEKFKSSYGPDADGALWEVAKASGFPEEALAKISAIVEKGVASLTKAGEKLKSAVEKQMDNAAKMQVWADKEPEEPDEPSTPDTTWSSGEKPTPEQLKQYQEESTEWRGEHDAWIDEHEKWEKDIEEWQAKTDALEQKDTELTEKVDECLTALDTIWEESEEKLGTVMEKASEKLIKELDKQDEKDTEPEEPEMPEEPEEQEQEDEPEEPEYPDEPEVPEGYDSWMPEQLRNQEKTLRKGLYYRTKGKGEPCKRGESAARSGCIPAKKKPSNPKVRPSPFKKPVPEDKKPENPPEVVQPPAPEKPIEVKPEIPIQENPTVPEFPQNNPDHPEAKRIREDVASRAMVDSIVKSLGSNPKADALAAKLAAKEKANETFKKWQEIKAIKGDSSPEANSALQEWLKDYDKTSKQGYMEFEAEKEAVRSEQREQFKQVMKAKNPAKIEKQYSKQMLVWVTGKDGKRTTDWAEFHPSAELEKSINDGTDFIQSITEAGEWNPTTIEYKTSLTGRAGYGQSQKTLPRPGFWNRLLGKKDIVDENTMSVADNSQPSTIAHELGHHIDDSKPGVREKVLEFMKYRLGDEQAIDMVTVPGGETMKGEMVKKNHFDRFFKGTSAYYVGKDYFDKEGKRYGTEIVSMGVQALYEDPLGFCQKDPEYATFIIGILRM